MATTNIVSIKNIDQLSNKHKRNYTQSEIAQQSAKIKEAILWAQWILEAKFFNWPLLEEKLGIVSEFFRTWNFNNFILPVLRHLASTDQKLWKEIKISSDKSLTPEFFESLPASVAKITDEYQRTQPAVMEREKMLILPYWITMEKIADRIYEYKRNNRK